MRVSDAEDSSTAPLIFSKATITQGIRISINVYDLLPPGRLSSFLWNVGLGCVHSGVVVGDREYAFGAHQKPGVTGIYYTHPGREPPGGTFRCEIVQGSSSRSQDEIEEIIAEASEKFLGTDWLLLKNNCNHFTSYLCKQLTGRPPPSWLNRAASIGICLPCIVPQDWVEAPDAETDEGELLDVEDTDNEHDAASKDQHGSDMHDDESDYEAHLVSDASSTDDDMRGKWRRKRRLYKDGSSSDLLPPMIHKGQSIPVSDRAPGPSNGNI